MMSTRTELVRAFHEKQGHVCDLALPCQLPPIGEHFNTMDLHCVAEILQAISDRWENTSQVSENADPRIFRGHLILEEVAETLRALAIRDVLMLLDGLADTSYVLEGTAVTYGLPLDEAFLEVHRSNMTKAKRVGQDVHGRVKGDSYSPPNLAALLKEHK